MSKRIKVFVLVNTLQSVTSFVYANHIDFFVHTAKNRPDIDFRFFTPHRMSIDMARNTAADLALRHECDYLMFIDDDVLIPSWSLDALLKADKDICAGLVIIRGMPFNVMAFKFVDENQTQLDYLNKIPLVKPCDEGHEFFDMHCKACEGDVYLQELVKCDAVGFSCCLIKTDVLKPMQPPYFVTGPSHTEDVYFCLKARELEPMPEIYVHTGVRCGHLLNPEPIEFGTRKKFYDFFEKDWKTALKQPSRDAAHIQRCLASLDTLEVVQ